MRRRRKDLKLNQREFARKAHISRSEVQFIEGDTDRVAFGMGSNGSRSMVTGGSALVLQPIVSIILLAVWFGVRKLTKKASVASLTIAVGLPVGVAIKGAPGWEVAAVVGVNVLVIIRHLDNIKRLVGGSELSANKRA